MKRMTDSEFQEKEAQLMKMKKRYWNLGDRIAELDTEVYNERWIRGYPLRERTVNNK